MSRNQLVGQNSRCAAFVGEMKLDSGLGAAEAKLDCSQSRDDFLGIVLVEERARAQTAAPCVKTLLVRSECPDQTAQLHTEDKVMFMESGCQ